MNVLLIYPEFPDTFWSFKYALKFIRKKAAYPPLGLLTVAAMLPDEFHRRLVDTNVSGLSDDDLAWADIAFIGAMAVQRDSAKQIITRCKATGLKVVAGGPLFTAETQTASPGHYPRHIRLSFPENMRDTYSLIRPANYPTKPEGNWRKQIRMYYE